MAAGCLLKMSCCLLQGLFYSLAAIWYAAAVYFFGGIGRNFEGALAVEAFTGRQFTEWFYRLAYPLAESPPQWRLAAGAFSASLPGPKLLRIAASDRAVFAFVFFSVHVRFC